jgi:hypothetical protein
MAAKLSVSIRPETETPDVTRIKQTLFARVKYTREIPTEEQVTEIPVTIKIDGSRRAELAIDGTAQIDVDDHAPKAPFAVQIEAAQGTVLWESPQQKSGEGDTRHIFKVPDAVSMPRLTGRARRPAWCAADGSCVSTMSCQTFRGSASRRRHPAGRDRRRRKSADRSGAACARP